MFLGVDLGTSAAKAVVIDDEGAIVAQASSDAIPISRPHPLWSEQDPADWLVAAADAVRRLPAAARRAVKSIGLTGQMHGATLLDRDDHVLRPGILWNDGRAHAECAEMETRHPEARRITGNKAMPGFTAPKLNWVARHESDVFAKTCKILLPKDYLRFHWTGEYATDVSDASGTLWLDVGARAWSEPMLAASGLSLTSMPLLYEGTGICGKLRASIALDLGLAPNVRVVAGGGDNAAGAVGIGAVAPGDAFLSLGTSGVLFAVTPQFQPNPDEAVHAFAHAVPGVWHQMAVHLSAASALEWAAQICGFASVAVALDAARSARSDSPVRFLPYLAGERTPHDNPFMTGVLFGMGGDTDKADIIRAVLEGVAFGFADGQAALGRAGTTLQQAALIGGGSRSDLWAEILASILGIDLIQHSGAESGPALGAARLARASNLHLSGSEAFAKPTEVKRFSPNPNLAQGLAQRYAHWTSLRAALLPLFVGKSS